MKKIPYIHLTEVTVSGWDGLRPNDLDYFVQVEPNGVWLGRLELYELDEELSDEVDKQAEEEAYDLMRRKTDLRRSLSREKLN